MGFLSFLPNSSAAGLMRLPQGSFTLDRNGRVVASTLPQSFPLDRVEEVGRAFLAAFRSAQTASLPLAELIVEYSALRLTARELRGGAIVFMTPQSPGSKSGR